MPGTVRTKQVPVKWPCQKGCIGVFEAETSDDPGEAKFVTAACLHNYVSTVFLKATRALGVRWESDPETNVS